MSTRTQVATRARNTTRRVHNSTRALDAITKKQMRGIEVLVLRNALSMLVFLLHVPRVPFIAPRQLGAVESIPGRLILPSIAWRTGQSGAPPDTVRCRSLSLFGEADRWRLGAVGAPDSPVPQCDRWLGHASRAESSAGRCPGRPLAHRTVRCTTGQSGEF
jgi:hypothetical protein